MGLCVCVFIHVHVLTHYNILCSGSIAGGLQFEGILILQLIFNKFPRHDATITRNRVEIYVTIHIILLPAHL